MTIQLYDKGSLWWVHSLPCNEEIARELFIEKFGYNPEIVQTENKFLYLGPVKEQTNEMG